MSKELGIPISSKIERTLSILLESYGHIPDLQDELNDHFIFRIARTGKNTLTWEEIFATQPILAGLRDSQLILSAARR
ncbi:MAG TPA: hypothetical protein VJI96_01950 [Candidatus Andersenbacteria bacterium]|nr:hypothetical protein [Candidatus Andersenbacteria bacterium]